MTLAFHSTPSSNVDSIFENGLTLSAQGSMGSGAYLAFGVGDVADYRRGHLGAIIVCLCAMDDTLAYPPRDARHSLPSPISASNAVTKLFLIPTPRHALAACSERRA